MAGLLGEVRAASAPLKTRCRVAETAAVLDERDAVELREALEDRVSYTTSAIARVLRARGYEMAVSTVGMHRNGTCVCARSAG